MSTYRAPLLESDDKGSFHLSNDHFRCLTYAQLARFGEWSIETGKPVLELMRGWMIEEDTHERHRSGDHNAVILTGKLPHCDLFGGLLSDGSTHT